MLKKQSLKVHIILSFSILVLIFIIATLAIVYAFSKDMLESATIKYAKYALAKISDNIDYLLKDVDQISINILTDTEINALLNKRYEQGSYEDIQRSYTLETKLRTVYKNSYSFNVEVYLLTEDVFVSTYRYVGRDVIEKSGWYMETAEKNKNLIFTKVHNVDYQLSSIKNTIALIRSYKSSKVYNQEIGKIIIDIDINEIEKIIANREVDKNAKIFIVDNKGSLLAGEEDFLQTRRLIDNDKYEEILQKDEGLVLLNNELGSDVLLYYTSPFSGWKIIHVVAYTDFMKNVTTLRYIIIFIGTLSFALFTIMALVVSGKITRPLLKLRDTMENVREGDMNVSFYSNAFEEVQLISEGFNSMLDEINDLIKTLYEKEKEKRDAILYSLQAQINPHFLYNTLNTVRIMARRYKAEDITDVIVALTDLLQESISNPNEIITLKEELDNAKSYIKIQQYRYNDNFKVVYHIDQEETLGYIVPKLIIQPIIENAIFHGIEPKGRPGTICISIGYIDNHIEIVITDDGVGFKTVNNMISYSEEPDKDKFKNIGLKNVNDRLKLYFGENYGLNVFSIPGVGTSVYMKIPAKDHI